MKCSDCINNFCENVDYDTEPEYASRGYTIASPPDVTLGCVLHPGYCCKPNDEAPPWCTDFKVGEI